MLIVKSKINDNYSILDTDDMSVESVSKLDLIGYLEQGIIIYGVTLFSLQNDTNLELILRLYGEDVKDFNGLLFQDYSNSYNEFLTQIIDGRENEDILNSDTKFNAVLGIIREYNNVNLDFNTDLPVGYKVFASNGKTLSLRELSTGNLYQGCDFYTCLFIYIEEGLSIDGIQEITYNHMIYNNDYYGAYSVLSTYRDSSSNSTVQVVNNEVINEYDDISCTWNDIDNQLSGVDYVRVTDMGFPIFNIKKRINRIEGNYPYIDFEQLSRPVCQISQGTLIFDNGSVLTGSDMIAKYFNILRFESDEVKSDVERYIEVVKSKEALLKVDKGVTKNINFSKNRSDCEGVLVCPKYKINDFKQTGIIMLRLASGLVYIEQSSLINNASSFSSMFLVRITHTGSCWFSTSASKIVIATMKSMRDDLVGNDYKSACMTALTSGITYFNDLITPLGVAKIHTTKEGVDISIACLIAADENGELAHSMNVIYVPLLFLGARLDEFDDCFRLRGLFNTLVLEKSVVYNLYGTFDEDKILEIWDSNLNTKPARKLCEFLYKHSKKVLGKVQ